jgi:hypothetical protein
MIMTELVIYYRVITQLVLKECINPLKLNVSILLGYDDNDMTIIYLVTIGSLKEVVQVLKL